MDPTSAPGLTRRMFAQNAAGAFAAPMVAQIGAAQAGTLTADLGAPTVRFDRMLFGQFLEHFHRQVYGGVFEPGSPLADKRGLRTDVIAAIRELKAPIVRWPGGCFVSAYHWIEGVGAKREPSFDKAWGVEDPNTFGTDEYVAWCRAIGAEPYICTNAGTGTEEEMSNWVEYCNLPTQGRYARMRRANGHTEPHNVKYWSIGNENYLGSEIGAKTVAAWGPLVREAAKMMRAVDKNIRLLAAATTTGDWTVGLLKDAGRYLDYISIHGYWDRLWQKNEPSGYLQCMMRTEDPARAINEAVALLDRTGFKGRIKIAYDEWNLRGWHHPGFPGGGTSQDLIKQRDGNDRNEIYTMADAVFSASFLNACLRQAEHVTMACMAPVVNARGPIYVHPKGIVKRPTFHVLKMYSDLLEPNVVPAKVTCDILKSGDGSVPVLDGVVTASDDRKRISIALINRHPDSVAQWKLALSQLPGTGKARITVLAGDSPDAYNDVSRPARVIPEEREIALTGNSVELPAHSVAVIRL